MVELIVPRAELLAVSDRKAFVRALKRAMSAVMFGGSMSLHDLEDDVLRHILSLLDIRSRNSLCCAHPRYAALARELADPILNVSLERVTAEDHFSGFRLWLLKRLHGPLVADLKSLELSISSDAFAGHQLCIFEALSVCRSLTRLQMRSAARYSEFDWAGVAALPLSLRHLDLSHFNVAFQLNDAGEREVTLEHLDRLTALTSLRVSCMPQPHRDFQSDALWRLVPAGLTCLRELRYLELCAAFGEFREDFGLPTNFSCLGHLTQLRIKVSRMAVASMAAVARLPSLAALRLQCGPPCLPLELAPLSRASALRSLSLAFDMRHRAIDLAQVPPGTQVPVAFDLANVPQVRKLRLMIFPDNPAQPSNVFQMHFAALDPAALAAHQVTLLDLRLANATAVLSLELLMRLAALRQLRVQCGVLDLQPPVGDGGQPTYRGAAGYMLAWMQRLQGLHMRCERATPKTSAVLQAFEMLDSACIYDARTAEQPPQQDTDQEPPPQEQQHLWKGDVNSASVAAWGLEA